MGELNPAIDFLDVLSEDIPKGEATELGLPYTNTCHLLFRHVQLKKHHILQDLLQVFQYLDTSLSYHFFI